MPARTAYDQWALFERFPDFMDDVVEVRRIDEVRLRWVAVIDGERREWDAKITEDEPGRRIAWRSTSGARDNGSVEFTPIDDGTRVAVRMDRQDGRGGGGVRRHRVHGRVHHRVGGESREAGARAVQAPHRVAGPPLRGAGRGAHRSGGLPRGHAAAGARPAAGNDRGRPGGHPRGDGPGRRRRLPPRFRALPRGQDRLARGPHTRGAGRDVTFVPDDNDAFLVVPYSIDVIKRSPTLDDEEELTPELERQVYAFYDRAGYWEAIREAVRIRQTTPAPTPEIAEAEILDALAEAGDPEALRVTRWA